MTVKVFIDANLLFYKLISDLLFDASNLGLIEAFWSEAVIDEYIEHGPRILNESRKKRNLLEDDIIAKQMIDKKVKLFKNYSGFTLVEDYESVKISESLLDDKDDIHVLKAAMKAKCSVLLSLDKGFRQIASLDDLKIIAQKADEFFCDLFDKHEDQMMDVIEKTRRGLQHQRKIDIELLQLVDMMKTGCLVGLSCKLYNFLRQNK